MSTLNSRILQIIADLGPELDKAVDDAAHDIRDDIEISMQQIKHGRIYHSKRTLTGAPTHQASAPGESPAIESADYINSIKPNMITKLGVGGVGTSEGEVSTDSKYGLRLEFGDVHVAKRPHMGVAADSVWPDYVNDCIDAVLKAVS